MLGVKIPDKPEFATIPRSPKWPAVRRKWLKLNPVCEVCNRKTKLEVHHIIPFHLKPELELDENNFITLCENPAAFCHYIIGHCAISWLKYDPYVVHNAAVIKIMRLEARP